MSRKHAGLDSEYSHDDTLKRLLSEALECRSQLKNKQEALIQLWIGGAKEDQLKRCSAASRQEFLGVQLSSSCGYNWQKVFTVGADGLDSVLGPVIIPLDLPPCQTALIWESVLALENSRIVQLGQLRIFTDKLCPDLVISQHALCHEKFASAIAGLVLAASEVLTSVDIRQNEYPLQTKLDISRAVCCSTSISSFNALTVQNNMHEEFSNLVRRNENSGNIPSLHSMVPENMISLRFLDMTANSPKVELDFDEEEWEFVLSRAMRQYTHPADWKQLQIRNIRVKRAV